MRAASYHTPEPCNGCHPRFQWYATPVVNLLPYTAQWRLMIDCDQVRYSFIHVFPFLYSGVLGIIGSTCNQDLPRLQHSGAPSTCHQRRGSFSPWNPGSSLGILGGALALRRKNPTRSLSCRRNTLWGHHLGRLSPWLGCCNSMVDKP
jgi:hypothetical protein